MNTTCVSGACQGSCAPGQTNCSGDLLQSCDANGNWTAGTFTLNSCGVVCTPTTTQCSGDLLQTCQSNGTWNTGSVANGQCSAVCSPNATQCEGTETQSCGTSGTWNSGIIVVGSCGAVCTPNATQCSGSQTQTCNANGTWNAGSVVAGSCGATCNPNATQCSGDLYETCGSSGTWNSGALTLGQCGVVCTPNATQCSGALCQSCGSNGTWNTGSLVIGQCGVVCNPGASQCSGIQTQSCGTNGQWTTSNCPGAANVALKCSGAGVCGFSCNSGYADCDNNPSNGCEANLSSDGNNCGACGKGCCGSTCSSSTCQAGSTGITATHFDTDGTNLYWTDGNSINKAPKTNLNSVTQLTTNQGSVGSVTTNGSYVFWDDSASVSVGTCAPENGLWQIPVGGGSVTGYSCRHLEGYPGWLSVVGQKILSMEMIPGQSITYDTINTPSGSGYVSRGGSDGQGTIYYNPPVSDGTYVYAIDDTAYQASVLRYPVNPINSSNPSPAVEFVQTGINNTKVFALATDGVNLYWSYAGTPSDNDADAGIYKTALSGGGALTTSAWTLVSLAFCPDANIGADGSYVYYFQITTGGDGTFNRVPVGGGTAHVIAPINIQNEEDLSRPIRFDSQCVFWSDTTLNTFRRVP